MCIIAEYLEPTFIYTGQVLSTYHKIIGFKDFWLLKPQPPEILNFMSGHKSFPRSPKRLCFSATTTNNQQPSFNSNTIAFVN